MIEVAEAPKRRAPVGVAEAAVATKREPVQPIPRDCWTLGEFGFQSHFCKVPLGTRIEDLEMNHEIFSFIADKFGLYDNVRVVSSAGDWMADVVIVDHGPNFALGHVVSVVEMPARMDDTSHLVPPGYTVRLKHVGDDPGLGASTWVVFRDADGVCMSYGQQLHTKLDAMQLARNHASVRKT